MSGLISADVRHDVQAIRSVLAGYQRGADVVLVRTLNRVMPSVKSKAAGELAAQLGIKRSVAAKALFTSSAFIGRLTTDMGASTKRIPLIQFNARQTGAGVTYKIGQAPRKLLPRAFINDARGFGPSVLRRAQVGDRLVPRYPIFVKYGPSPAAKFIQDTFMRLLDTTARERWTRELSAQLKFFLSQQ